MYEVVFFSSSLPPRPNCKVKINGGTGKKAIDQAGLGDDIQAGVGWACAVLPGPRPPRCSRGRAKLVDSGIHVVRGKVAVVGDGLGIDIMISLIQSQLTSKTTRETTSTSVV